MGEFKLNENHSPLDEIDPEFAEETLDEELFENDIEELAESSVFGRTRTYNQFAHVDGNL